MASPKILEIWARALAKREGRF
ncbi:hypothetical protein MESS2_90013 [Mesorhizobium metallidurans STM 2683]|uniref:Uncharacterized protein n=1 Tax=Mesorhizobium metallidurans STM 2683 TaxID=1297569 RepID=M5EYT0_9HYPH|nr:hypothetical protein MESS2_90013 [Mesorhizobium metallidurans STM 2683]